MSLNLSEETQMFLQQVHTRAEELGHEYILPEHLLYQFTETPATIELLEMFQVSPEELREELTMSRCFRKSSLLRSICSAARRSKSRMCCPP